MIQIDRIELASHLFPSEVLRKLAFIKVVEVGVLHCHAAGDALVWLEGYHAGEEVQAVLIQVLSMLGERQSLPFGESWLEVGQLQGC